MSKISHLKIVKAEEESAGKAQGFVAPSVNESLLPELEARYGELVAWSIMERMPKTKVGK